MQESILRSSVEDGLSSLPKDGYLHSWVAEMPAECRNHRLLDRNRGATFKQSSGRLNIRRLSNHISTRYLRMSDWFHTLVSISTAKLVLFSSSVIVVSWLVYAIFFWAVATECGLKADTFMKALYLSIETIETIGYGLPDAYFKSCPAGIFILGAASLWQTFIHAVLIGLIFTRISRAAGRASSVCFSEKAIISEIEGKPYFMFQVCDFRKHQLCEAHIRLYSVRHAETNSGVAFQTRAMRLQHPDDELGAMLLLALPQVVVHRIDSWSPLWPDQAQNGPPTSFRFPDVLQRQASPHNQPMDSFCLDTAGVGKPTMLLNGSPIGSPIDCSSRVSLQDISRQLLSGQYEVLCLVEGIDAATSSTLQARHSYTCEDIVFNASFERCVSRSMDGSCEVNFDAFHKLSEVSTCSDIGQSYQSMP